MAYTEVSSTYIVHGDNGDFEIFVKNGSYITMDYVQNLVLTHNDILKLIELLDEVLVRLVNREDSE